MNMPAFNLGDSIITVCPNPEKVAQAIERLSSKNFQEQMSEIINEPAIKETLKRLSEV